MILTRRDDGAVSPAGYAGQSIVERAFVPVPAVFARRLKPGDTRQGTDVWKWDLSVATSEEQLLVKRCLAGEPQGLRAFVNQFQGNVFGLCLRMLRNRHDAEDATQDVFLRAFRSLHRWDSTRPLRPWLLTIAANRCRTVLSDRSRKPPPLKYCEHLAEPEQAPAVQSDLAEELHRALEQVREEYRLCFLLYHQQELNLAAIAEIMDCPEGTVKTWLYRVRRELAELLQRRGVVPQGNV